MLSQRSINKIGKHLDNEGWSDEEIDSALNALDTNQGVLNIALPLHFKEEAIQHAKCYCKYFLKIGENSPKYKKAYERGYSDYLIEAFENSRGIEGPNSGSHKRSNPAGVEVYAFDKISENFIPKTEKEEVSKKAPAGLIYMGKDSYLQKSIAEMNKNIKNPELIKNIVTQYSASVVSLSNSLLFAFGGYQTKRRYANTKIYGQTTEGQLETSANKKAESALEFSKGQDKNKMLEVAYRQITRQAYIITLNSIAAGVMSLDQSVVRAMEKGVEDKIKDLWQKSLEAGAKKGELNLAFVLKRETRDLVIKSFHNALEKQTPNARDEYLELIKNIIIKWANSESRQIPISSGIINE